MDAWMNQLYYLLKQLQTDNPRYHREFGHCLYRKGPSFYSETLHILEHSLQLSLEKQETIHYNNMSVIEATRKTAESIKSFKTYLKQHADIVHESVHDIIGHVSSNSIHKYELQSSQHKRHCIRQYWTASNCIIGEQDQSDMKESQDRFDIIA